MTVIVLDLVSKINKSYYPQILVEEYIYKEKVKVIESSSFSSGDDDDDESIEIVPD